MNLYYSPEKFGLTVVGEVEYLGGYEFDTTAVYRDARGRLAYIEDSGCSCPVPFEDKGVDDLQYCTPAELQKHLETKAADRHWTADDEGGTPFDAAIAELMQRVVA